MLLFLSDLVQGDLYRARLNTSLKSHLGVTVRLRLRVRVRGPA